MAGPVDDRDSVDIESRIDRLHQPPTDDRHAAIFDLLDLSLDEPARVAEHATVLLDVATAPEEDVASWAAAAALGNAAQERPGLVAPHVEDIVGALSVDTEPVREPLAGALTAVRSETDLPIGQLLAAVERDWAGSAQAIEVLGVVATTEPDRLPVERLERLLDADTAAARGAARYLLTLLSTAGRCDPPDAPDRSGYHDLSTALSETLPEGTTLQFLESELQRTAIDDHLAAALAEAGYHDMEIAQTPQGTQLVVQVADATRLDGVNAPPVHELADTLEAEFGLSDPQIDIQEVGELQTDRDGDTPPPSEAASDQQVSSGDDKSPGARGDPAPIPDEIPDAPIVSLTYDDLREQAPIGSGGNADVVRASAPTPDSEVTIAVKQPRVNGTLHTDQVERLLAEAETWAQLDDHEHVVGVVDWGSDPIPWIGMEYMDGGHLGGYLGEMDIDRALWTAIQTTEAVRHAHRHGVAHLDLKPENILFRSVAGGWDVPKVADWGLSKRLLDHPNSIEGLSPHYAAPEQFDDEARVDDVTDIYQLGAVCYALFTGQPPFEGQPFEVMNNIRTETPTPPSEIAAVPAGVDKALAPALATDRPERYESVIFLRDALRDVFESR